MELYKDPQRIGRRKKICLYIKRCDHLADRGYNIAIEVFELNNKMKLLKIGGNYRIQSERWKGDEGSAIDILKEIYTDLKADTYLIMDNRIHTFAVI